MRLGVVFIGILFGVAFLATPNLSIREKTRSEDTASVLTTSCESLLPEIGMKRDAGRESGEHGLKLPDAHDFILAFADRPQEALLAFRTAAGENPSVVSDWWSQLPVGSARQETLPQLAAAWAEHDVIGASLWCQQLPPGAEREEAVLLISNEAAGSDAETALALASLLTNPAAQETSISHAYTQWAARDLDAASAWADQLPPGRLREHALAELALVVAERDGVAAASLVASSLTAEQDQISAAVGVVQRWAQKSPSQAADWVALFPEGDTMNNAAYELMSIWTATSPTEASKWFDSVPEGPFRKACVQALATLNADLTTF